MKPDRLTMDRPRFQPGFEPDSCEVEEMPHSRKGKLKTPYLYVALSAAATIFWIMVCYVILS